jgi:AraC family transcriptional regulator, ethanolamine operon transcriptional activator
VRPLVSAARRAIVDRAEAYVHAHPGDDVTRSKLRRVVGLSERGLRNVFYSVRAMSPQRCMLVDRLDGVRHALSDVGSRPASVTSVATTDGFSERKRFSTILKKQFGEAPSETLRATNSQIGRERRP